MAIRVVIIEDEAVFRHMLSMALSRMRGLVVAGEFADGRVGLEYCLKEKPALLVVDLFLPGMHGLDIVREVRAKVPSTRILVLTGHPDSDLPARLMAQGVHGFVDKSEPINYVMQAIEAVMSGGMFFATNVPPKFIPSDAVAAGSIPSPTTPPPARLGAQVPSVEAVQILSGREIEVIQLVASGLSSKEIASRLDLSVRTVEKHRANIMEKIGVREVASLVRWCVQAGLVKT
ncbi:MAG: LuxR family transcriptional regulator [Verrucomicrobia bacterium]|nr:LuxR family transcriptional regulator [Verrucomicrobiota bacterium]